MSTKPKWKKFEQIIADIQKRLLPDAKVIHDYKYKDGNNKIWQIDVFIEQTIGLFTYRTIIECKDYRRSVSRDKIEGFQSKMRHVKAHAGIVISTSGFSDSATVFAQQENFIVMDYSKATQVDWEKLLGGSAWLNIVKPRKIVNMEYRLKVETGDWYTVPFHTLLYNGQANLLGTIQKRIFEDILYDSNILVQYVNFKIEANVKDMFVHNQEADGYIALTELYASGDVVHEIFTINLNLNEGDVITESGTDKIMYKSLSSDSIDLQTVLVQREGQIISSDEFLRIQKESMGNFVVDTKNLKQYIRVSFTQKIRKDI